LVPGNGYVDVPAYPVSPPALRFRRYLILLRKKWWIVLLSLSLCSVLAAAYILWWPETYVSYAHLWSMGRTGLRLPEGGTYEEDAQTSGGTQVELLQSGRMNERAFNRIVSTLHLPVPTNSEGLPEPVKIRVSQLPKSAVFEIKATGPNDSYTRAFLDATIDEFLAFKREIRATSAGDTYTSVSEQITKQETDLKSGHDTLTAYMRDNNVAVLEEQAKAASAYLTQLLAEFSQLKLEHQLLEATSTEGLWALAGLTNALAGAPDPRRLADPAMPSASPPPEFLGAQQELEKLRIMRTRLSKHLRPEHPKIVKLDEEISRGEKLVEFLSKQSRDQLANARQTVKLKLDRIQETIKEWEAKVNSASERIAQYQRLKLNVDRLQGLHERLLGLLQTVDVTRNLDQENITILDRASAPRRDKSSVPFVLALAIFLGLGGGLGLVFLVEVLNDRVMSLEDLNGRFNEWVVGQVPEVGNAKKKKRPALLDADDRRHIFAESYRNMRSALFYAAVPEEKPKALLITSAIPREGKSTVAANLARAIAFAGSRVLLVDGDLRRGLLHELFELPQEPGFADLLTQGGDLARFVVPTSVPNLSLLPRGKPVGNSGELFLGAGCDRVLAQIREQYDCAIIDSIPVFAADDTTSLAPKVDGVLLVVRGSYAGSRTIRRAMELLYERQAKIMGLVFNRANSASRSYEYYKYADYYHSAGKDH
jgi:capsular exopolysaccharide synthesis family protein